MPRIFIQLERPMGFFDSGELLTGRVIIMIVGSPLAARGVHISFFGKANVFWTETRGNGQYTYTVSFSNDELIFADSITVWGNRGESAPTLKLPIGQYVFDFSFPIPLVRENGFPLPSSFTGESGSIRYHVKAHLERTTMPFDSSEEELVYIRGAYDLNTDPRAPLPSAGCDDKTLSSWCCCASGQIEAYLRTDKGGYVAGEMIRVFVQVNNRSSEEVQPITLRLIQRIHYVSSSNGHAYDQTTTLNTIERNDVLPPRKTLNWDNDGLVIPTAGVPSTISFGSCGIMQVGYQVQLRVNPCGCSSAFTVETEVILGTVSLLDSADVSSK